MLTTKAIKRHLKMMRSGKGRWQSEQTRGNRTPVDPKFKVTLPKEKQKKSR